MAIRAESGEKLQGSWTVNYLTAQGERYNGKLKLSNFNLYFEANFEVRISGVEAIEGGMKIPLENILKANTFSEMFIFKRLRIELRDGSVLVFDRGISPVGGIAKAVNRGIR